MNPIFINLPTPSFNRKLIWRHFDSPDNPDNLGYIRCKTCYERFPDSFRESEMIEHLKTHNHSWTRFFECLESRLSHKYNHKRVLYDDLRKESDLKLFNGLCIDDLSLVIRFPKSRTERVRYFTDRWTPNDSTWNKLVAEEYQNNKIGSHQGNFDRPISDKKYRCGNTLLTFSEFVSYRHEPADVCKVFDVNRGKYEELNNQHKISAYFVTNESQTSYLSGPSTSIYSQRIDYTCTNGFCKFPCLCKACVLQTKECDEHEIIHPNLFNPSKHFFTVRNSDDYDITGNEGKLTYSNSLEKGYEMIYDVYKYAGILKNCVSCTDDIFHHQAFHFVYHDNCKFCRASKHRIEGIRTHNQFLNRFEERRYKEEMSCHVCYKVFSSTQSRDNHISNVHENKKDNFLGCDDCDKVFSSKAALRYHVDKTHGQRNELKCRECGKIFAMKQNLDVHMKSVHSFASVKCTICHQSFTRQSNLTSHYNYVHDVVDNYLVMDDGIEIQYYECEECSFESRYEKNLRKHILTVHSEERKFNCTECPYVSNRMDNLSMHIKTQHSSTATIFACEECDYTSKYIQNVRKHVKKVHSK